MYAPIWLPGGWFPASQETMKLCLWGALGMPDTLGILGTFRRLGTPGLLGATGTVETLGTLGK